MTFEEWGKDNWKVRCRDDDRYELKAPSVTYVFNEHDLLHLYQNIGAVAEHLFEKEVYYIHDDQVFNRETGEQFIGAIGDCEELNRLYKENMELKQDNDIKFWKLQLMEQWNTTQLITHELSLAIDNGYEVSDKFKEYIDDLKKKHEENIEKAERLGI